MSLRGKELLKFFKLVGDLKHIPRTGWVRKNVENPESIAGHMYRMGVMAMMLTEVDGVDRDKCIRMALVHDLAESIVGDLTPDDPVTSEEKRDRESKALREMVESLEESVAQEIVLLWEEYEAAQTPEALLVKDLDKFDMILQAHEYEERENCPGRLDEFFTSTRGKFKTETVKDWVANLEILRRTK